MAHIRGNSVLSFPHYTII